MAQKIEITEDDMSTRAAAAPADRKLRFEGTVELGGAVTGQMLGILFGPDSNVNGTLQFDGAVQIDGTFRGAIKTSDLLMVGEQAKIDADITCGSAVVKGEINGNITATSSVELQGRAHVKGDITSPALSVERGAMFDGASRMESMPTTRRRPNRS